MNTYARKDGYQSIFRWNWIEIKELHHLGYLLIKTQEDIQCHNVWRWYNTHTTDNLNQWQQSNVAQFTDYNHIIDLTLYHHIHKNTFVLWFSQCQWFSQWVQQHLSIDILLLWMGCSQGNVPSLCKAAAVLRNTRYFLIAAGPECLYFSLCPG